jgi:hypothetical protein
MTDKERAEKEVDRLKVIIALSQSTDVMNRRKDETE